MSELHIIQETLEKTARRRRVEHGLRGLWNGLLAGVAFWLGALVIYKLTPIPMSYVWMAGGIGLCMALAGFVAGFAKRVTLFEVARWVDGKKHLQERLSTALEVAGEAKDETWRGLIVSDAAKRIKEINPRELLPFNLPKASRWALILLICGVGLGFVPEYRSKNFVAKKQEQQVIKETGRELAALTRRTLENRPPALEATKKAIETVNELGEKLQNATLTKSDALKDLASVTDKLKEQTKDLARDPALKNMERAAKSSSKGGTPAADLQKQIDALSKQLGDKAANSDALEKFKQDLDKAKMMAGKLPDKNSPERKSAEDKLAASLADMAKQARDLGLDLPSLSEAIAALQNSMPDQVFKDLQIAEVELEKVQQMAKALEKMQLDAQKLGKDLAEQLKSGQAEAAQSTLEKMAQDLKSGKMSEEQMKKVMEEVSKALDPAKNYGDVKDMLAKSVDQMKAGQKADAAQSLQNASAELAKMMQEMGDAQSLLATLEALQQAQMCIANGQGWNQNSKGRPGYRPGENRAGKGFGDWTDEDSWQYPEFMDKWDNSGLTRDEKEGKGISDRGDGQLADNLSPTKIKGQMTPGGPMPSVTLKGVSVKGTSKVNFKDMSAGAQSDAQSALNQDQVPKAYQGAVRNYFDDLKE